MKVLVAYASKHHATAEIAMEIGRVLQQFNELTVDIQTIDQLEFIAGYDAVVMGSAVYEGNWRPAAANFLMLHAQELGQIPVWLFSSGPLGEGNTKDITKGWEFPSGLRIIAAQIKPRHIAIFRGKLDVAPLSMLEQAAIRKMNAPLGDFREWEKIAQWANQIGQVLREEASISLKKN